MKKVVSMMIVIKRNRSVTKVVDNMETRTLCDVVMVLLFHFKGKKFEIMITLNMHPVHKPRNCITKLYKAEDNRQE